MINRKPDLSKYTSQLKFTMIMKTDLCRLRNAWTLSPVQKKLKRDFAPSAKSTRTQSSKQMFGEFLLFLYCI